uniref:H15 domain-containing protein n=1 Tax=Chrysemys picta bellii TaxID=8478 RepID=A0A8C3HLW5_CHRPI
LSPLTPPTGSQGCCPRLIIAGTPTQPNQPPAPPAAAALASPPKKPTLSQVILRAAAVPVAGRGASLAAIKKTLEGEGYDVRKNKGRIKAVLRYLLSQGALRRVSGSGASGSFRLQRGGGAPKAERRGTAAAKRRQSSAKTGTAAPGPNDPSGEIKPAAARPKRVSRSPGKTTKKKTAVKRPKTQIAARRSPKKINLTAARKAKGPGRETKPAVKKPKAHKNPARPKGRAAPRGKAGGKRH